MAEVGPYTNNAEANSIAQSVFTANLPIIDSHIRQSVLTGYKTNITRASAAPTVPGLYIAQENGPYPNYGGLTADLSQGANWFYFNPDGTFFKEVISIDASQYATVASLASYIKNTTVTSQNLHSPQFQGFRPGYIDANGALQTLTPDAGAAISYIGVPVKASTTYALSGYGTIHNDFGIGFEDASGNVIGNILMGANVTSRVFTTPANTAALRYTTFFTTPSNPGSNTVLDAIQLREASSVTPTQAYSKNLHNPNWGRTAAGYIDSNGNVVNTTGALSFLEVPVQPNATYTLSGYGTTHADFGIAFEGVLGNVISTILMGANVQSKTFTTPADTFYIKYSLKALASDNTDITKIQLERNTAATAFTPYGVIAVAGTEGVKNPVKFNDPVNFGTLKQALSGKYVGKSIGLVGDSISSTDYTWYRQFIFDKTGAAKVDLLGLSGQTAAQIAANLNYTGVAAGGYDLIIYLPGGNDAGAATTVGSLGIYNLSEDDVHANLPDLSIPFNAGTYPKYVQAVYYIVKKLIAITYDFRGGDTAAYPVANGKFDSAAKPKVLLLNGLPQNRGNHNPGDDWNNHLNHQRKRYAAEEVAQYTHTPCLDTFRYCGWDCSIEPFYVGPTDKVNAKGIYTMDGLHPNKYGYDRLTDYIVEEIKGIAVPTGSVAAAASAAPVTGSTGGGATTPTPTAANVTYTSLKNIAQSGVTWSPTTNVGTMNWGQTGLASVKLPAGQNGYYQADIADSSSKFGMICFKTSNVNDGYPTTIIAAWVDELFRLNVIENGQNVTEKIVTMAAGQTYRITRTGSTFRVSTVNGSTITDVFTSSVTNAADLYLTCDIRGDGKLNNPQVYNAS